MLSAIGQYIGGRIITAVLIVSGAGAVIYFWRHPESLATIWQTLKLALIWMGFVLVLPWATWFVTPWVAAKESNLAAGLMLAAYSIVDAAFAFYLMGRVFGHGTLAWAVILLGFLCAGLYNFKACEYQAERAAGVL